MSDTDKRDQTSILPAEGSNAGSVPAWAQREDARSRRDEVAADRKGWTMVLQLAVPLVMILLASVLAFFGLR